MAKMVGLSRPLKLAWLNKTADLLLDGLDASSIKNDLNEYLAYEIKSPTNLRKTREILMSIWIATPVALVPLKQQALKAYQNEKGSIVAHWCMLLVTYPVFFDICSLIGKLTNIQDTFTSSWLNDKLVEIWGERTTLFFTIDKILQTLKALDVIEPISPGVYKVKKRDVSSTQEIEALLSALIFANRKTYYELSELSCSPTLFPFSFEVSYEWLHKTSVFKLSYFGGKIVLNSN